MEKKKNPLGGRPAYHPGTLLKLFILRVHEQNPFLQAIRKECYRNLEVMWLMRGLMPDHNTISNFRKDNAGAIKKVFRATVELAKNFELIGGGLLAGDGTALCTQNSKKNNYNQKKIDRHLAYIEAKLNEYNQIMASEDGISTGPTTKEGKEKVQKKIEQHLKHQEKYKSLEKQLEETDEVQISTSDPKSRQLIVRNMIIEVAYNLQSTVDAEHNIPINYEITNENDSKAMGGMLEQAVEILGHNEFTAVFDKGYHTGSEFVYNEKENTYTCPAGNTLKSNRKWYSKNRNYQGKKTGAYQNETVQNRCL